MLLKNLGGLMGPGGSGIPYVYDFNGTDMYATMGTGWEPLGLPYSIEFKAITDDVDAAAYAVAKDTATGVGVLFGGGTYIYDGITTPGTLSTTGGLVADTEYTYVVNANATETTLTVITEGTGTEVSKTVGQGELTTIGATGVPGTYWGGPIWGLRLTDDSPLQGRTVNVGDKVRYVQLNNTITLPAADDWVISFDWIRYDNNVAHTSSTKILGAADDSSNLNITDTQNVVAANRLNLKNSGVNISILAALDGVVEGQHCRVVFTKVGDTQSVKVDGVETGTDSVAAASVGDFTINRLLKTDTSPSGVGSALGNFVFENTTTGDTWVYALEDETA